MLWAERESFDLVLLDLMLPGLTGEEFITRIRRGRTMPIIVLSAKAGLEDKVNVLRLGADDFIPKPFDNLEVLARVEAQLRRVRKFSTPPERQRFVSGDLVLDREAFSVTAGGGPVVLTAREFEILALLMEYPKRVFTREQIYQRVGARSTSGMTTRSTSMSAICGPSWAGSATGSISRPSGASASSWRSPDKYGRAEKDPWDRGGGRAGPAGAGLYHHPVSGGGGPGGDVRP